MRLVLLLTIAVALAQPPAPPAAAAPVENPGTLVVKVDPPASLYVDTKLVTATEAEHRIDVEGGKLHRVRLIHPDYLDFVRTLRIEPAQTTTLVKQLRVPVTGTLGLEKAEVTAGGVALDEVDSRTMQSKRHPGLFLAGEVLDLDGWISGYNFQSAWSTGWLAGRHL